MKQAIAVLLLTGLATAAQTSEGNIDNGRASYVKIGCYQCHGYAGQGGIAGARLAGGSFKSNDLIRYVRRPPGEMPAYPGKVLSDQELTDIWAYIRTLPAPKPASEIPLLDRLRERK